MWAYISLKCQVEAGAQSREVNTMMKHWGEEPCGGEKRSKGIFKAVIFNPDLKMENTGKILSFQRRIFQCLTMFLGFLNRISWWRPSKLSRKRSRNLNQVEVDANEVDANSTSGWSPLNCLFSYFPLRFFFLLSAPNHMDMSKICICLSLVCDKMISILSGLTFSIQIKKSLTG